MSKIDLKRLDKILPQVRKPGRYIGHEYIAKTEKKNDAYKFAFCFPDIYDIGMSYLGLHIIYELINKRPDFICERVFAPWPDMEELMRANKIALYSVESFSPLNEFDIVGFTLPYQLNYTNILNMLNLGGIPLKSSGRTWPLVIAGGGGCFNPEPLYDFFDIFLLGDGEELVNEILDQYARCAPIKNVTGKKKLLQQLSAISGVYLPSGYEADYNQEGDFLRLGNIDQAVPQQIHKRVFPDLNSFAYTGCFPVPYVETVHERITIEVMRGCINGCRFCEAGFTHRPKRERDVNLILDMAKAAYKNTGYDEISLSSLSSTDYSQLNEAVLNLSQCFKDEKISIALSSLRAEDIASKLPQCLSKLKKTTFTFAPEAATVRLRRIINKNIDIRNLEKAAEVAFQYGWRHIKLYFMIGLPGETDADLEAILNLCIRISNIKKKINGKAANIIASISNFVPKPHTPFQWERMNRQEELIGKQKFIKHKLHNKNIILKFHNPAQSIIEAVISRGDRKIARVLETAFKLGAKFDAWDDYFNYDLWHKSFQKNNISISKYLDKKELKQPLPWEHMLTGVSPVFLEKEYQMAEEEKRILG
ncbi:MAG: TIGR03960 family B12-binding radical SAM protein [Candidatus Omnitrophota bacterium]